MNNSALFPYLHSVALHKIMKQVEEHKNPCIAFLDIDSTMTATKGKLATNKARELLEKKGYVVVYVTSRTEEIIMSDSERRKSHLDRPLPHLAQDENGRYYYEDPAFLEPKGILDPDIIIGSTGTNILLKQTTGGYLVDTHFRASFPMDFRKWRTIILHIVEAINQKEHFGIPNPIESIDNYKAGITNVAPPDYRIELKFETVEQKRRFAHLIAGYRDVGDPYKNFQVTDDSNPEKEKFALYITPYHKDKVHSVEYVVEALCQATKLERQQLHLLLAGDSYPDLAMGLYGGLDTKATFLLVGNSRLTSYLIDEDEQYFADESLREIKKSLIVHESGLNGVYNFVLRGSGQRRVIIGDEALPGTQGPETIIAFLSKKRSQMLA